MAVDLFFCLSGFILYWLYAMRIAENTLSTREFAILRFSRLYPLHFFTLLLVAIGQITFMNEKGYYFVVQYNDPKHFLLNLLFASHWGFQNGNSFNAPIWSVSLEVLLYSVFFLCCRRFPIKRIALLFFSIAWYMLDQNHTSYLARGFGSFFLGGYLFITYQNIITSRRADVLTKCLSFLTVAAWLVTFTVTHSGLDLTKFSIDHPSFELSFASIINWALIKGIYLWPYLVLFPLTILSLAMIETQNGSFGKRFTFLGNISYSVYLLHFPLMLGISLLATRLSINQTIFYSPWLMGIFFFILLWLSIVSYRYFEMPAQSFLRRKWLANSSRQRFDTPDSYLMQ